jgi:hypothetical protein
MLKIKFYALLFGEIGRERERVGRGGEGEIEIESYFAERRAFKQTQGDQSELTALFSINLKILFVGEW